MRKTSYVTCPCGKRAYRTEDEAELMLDLCRRQRNGRRARMNRKENRIYRCDWTDYWHLTSKEYAA